MIGKTTAHKFELPSDEMVAVLRQKTGAERLEIASRMFGTARRMLISHLTREHPDWDELRIDQEAARRLSHGAV